MSISFLSKLTRVNATCPQLVGLKKLNVTNHGKLHALARSLIQLSQAKPLGDNRTDVEKENPLRATHSCCHFHIFRRCYSSSTSSSGSDGGEKGKSSEDDISVPLKPEGSQVSNSNEGLPPPACASLQRDFTTRPLDEHEIGLDLSRRGRSKPPLGDGTTVNQSSPGKGHVVKKDKQPRGPAPTSSPPKIKASSRRRAKDRLEALSRKDCDRRVFFAYKLLLIVEDEPEILDNILWTDECNFNLPKLPSLITKPPVAESELLPQIAWCGMSTTGTVGPYFFNSHVTDKSYVRMLEDYLLPELEKKGYNLKELWFQQDGAPWHRSKLVLDFLTSVFDYRIISLGTKFIWPPRSQDLTPMDYFFWDYMKLKLDFKHSKYDLCFQKSFREILTNEVNTASLNALQGAIYQLPERLEMCVSENGARFVHLLYPDRYEKDGTRKARKQGDELLKKSTARESTSHVIAGTNDTNASSFPPLPDNLNINNSNSNNSSNTNITSPP